MDLLHIFALLGGLGLFLYGMKLMSDGLESVAGSKMRQLFETLTKNRFMALLLGIAVTAIVQSSSATTVMVVGFLNAGLMNLVQATGIIMGANIGTCLTVGLLALNLESIAPLIIFIGVATITFGKKSKVKNIGYILAGFGILFFGMNTMKDAMQPLAQNEGFTSLMAKLENPFLGILTGALVTAVIQSSAASIGILQNMVYQGIMPFGSAIFVLFGQNIGTCVTALIASIGASKPAKRASAVHLLFNIIGTIIFVGLIFLLRLVGFDFADHVVKLVPGNLKWQITIVHLTFNILTTLILFPFAKWIVKIAEALVPGVDPEAEGTKLKYLDKRFLTTPPIAIAQLNKEIERMINIAINNYQNSMNSILHIQNNEEIIKEVYEREKVINYLNHEITHYLVEINALDITDSESNDLSGKFHVLTDIERVGDHAENLVECAEGLKNVNAYFSDEAYGEIKEMGERVSNILNHAKQVLLSDKYEPDLINQIRIEEEKIDSLTESLKEKHIKRLTKQTCSPSVAMTYNDILLNLERVADHSTNIAYSRGK